MIDLTLKALAITERRANALDHRPDVEARCVPRAWRRLRTQAGWSHR